MTSKGQVTVTIVGDASSVKKAAKETEQAIGRLDAPVKAAHKSFDELTSMLTSRFGPAGAEAKKVFDGIGSQALTSGGMVSTGLAIGGIAIAAFAVKGV